MTYLTTVASGDTAVGEPPRNCARIQIGSITPVKRRARRRVAMGLERRGAGTLRGATCTGPEAWAGEAGVGICLPDRQGVGICLPGHRVGWRPDSRRRRQLSSIRSWSSTGLQRRRLGPRTSVVASLATGPTAGGLPRPGDLRPWGQGAPAGPTGPGLIIHSVLQVTGLEHAARTRRPMGVHPLLLLLFLRQLGTRHRTPAWLRLGPA